MKYQEIKERAGYAWFCDCGTQAPGLVNEVKEFGQIFGMNAIINYKEAADAADLDKGASEDRAARGQEE